MSDLEKHFLRQNCRRLSPPLFSLDCFLGLGVLANTEYCDKKARTLWPRTMKRLKASRAPTMLRFTKRHQPLRAFSSLSEQIVILLLRFPTVRVRAFYVIPNFARGQES